MWQFPGLSNQFDHTILKSARVPLIWMYGQVNGPFFFDAKALAKNLLVWHGFIEHGEVMDTTYIRLHVVRLDTKL